MSKRTAYVETPSGVWREEDGIMSGPFTREELGFTSSQYIPGCQMLRASGAYASISFGFGYGVRSDNTFEVKTRRAVKTKTQPRQSLDIEDI